jgi:hypothetical protein
MNDRIEDSLAAINEKLTQLRLEIAKQSQFWEETWPNAQMEIKKNEEKIEKLQLEFVAFKTRVMVWGTLGMSVASFIAAAVIRYILPMKGM